MRQTGFERRLRGKGAVWWKCVSRWRAVATASLSLLTGPEGRGDSVIVRDTSVAVSDGAFRQPVERRFGYFDVTAVLSYELDLAIVRDEAALWLSRALVVTAVKTWHATGG